jgi:hypothetical protein
MSLKLRLTSLTRSLSPAAAALSEEIVAELVPPELVPEAVPELDEATNNLISSTTAINPCYDNVCCHEADAAMVAGECQRPPRLFLVSLLVVLWLRRASIQSMKRYIGSRIGCSSTTFSAHLTGPPAVFGRNA